MNKNLIIIGLAFLLIFIGLGGCIDEDIVEGTGEIQYIDLEGGFYGIISIRWARYNRWVSRETS